MERTLGRFLIAFSVAWFSNLGATDGLASAPTGLEIAHLDQHTVLLGWNFTTPPDLEMQEVSFSLTIRENDQDVRKDTVQGAEELRYEATELGNGTFYSLEIHATHSNQTISDSLLANFTTMSKDWPLPDLHGWVTQRVPHLEYALDWTISRNDSLSEFILYSCLPECEQQSVGSNESSAVLAAPYYTEIFMSVAAIFDQPLDRRIVRHSKAFNRLSSVGPPSEIGGILKRELVENTLHLAWEPPSEPRGPISYYETQVLDSIEPHDIRIETTERTETDLSCPGYACDIKIRAVNIEPNTKKIFAGKFCTFRQKFKSPEAAKGCNVIEWKRTEMRFEIIPSVSYSHFEYFVDMYSASSGNPQVRDFPEPREKRIFNLDPYTTVLLNITTYVSSKKFDFSYYGGSLNVNLTSNVGVPSRVRSLRASFSSDGDPILMWRKPKKPSGPIDGYRIVIQDALNDTLINQTTVPHHAELAFQSFTYEDREEHKSYKFIVAAFNNDLESGEAIVGEETSVIPSKPFGYWVIIGVAVPMALLAVLVCILLHKQRKFGRERPEFRTSFTRNDTSRP